MPPTQHLVASHSLYIKGGKTAPTGPIVVVQDANETHRKNMKFFCLGVVLLAFCVVCEVLSDYSESILPSKGIRNRAQRTMRVNMRVGKRFGDPEYDDEAPKRRFRPITRIGKRTSDSTEQNTDRNTYYPSHTDTTADSIYEVDKWGFMREFLNPDGRLTVVFPPGKRSGQSENFSLQPRPETDPNSSEAAFEAPKRKLRMVMRTGKRNEQSTLQSTQNTLKPDISIQNDDIFSDILNPSDLKRSAPQFLLNPRVGKNDKTWSILHKRNDPKATDLWFGPRIGRSSLPEEYPWTYVIFNGNGASNLPVGKSNDLDEQREEPTD
ncbi:uncharacterized protein [Euwallacea similis]|uniref:uncharacterized protein isoform X2 n=1 Tax=Euwallacea similis TaxID=1736056 RepID=UPI00344CF9A6